MKNLIAIFLITIFTTGAFATSLDMTPVIARADGYYQGLQTVVLLADGRLQFVTEKGVVKTVLLNKKTFRKLSDDIIRISNVEVQTIRKNLVCMPFAMVVPNTLTNLSVSRYNYDDQSFSGDPRLVLSEDGCWVRNVTAPVHVSSKTDAQSVREQLVILALTKLS